MLATSARPLRRVAGDVPRSPEAVSPEATPGLRRPVLAVAAVALQAAPGLPGGDFAAHRHWFVVASGVLLAAWFVLNLRSATGLLRAALAVALLGATMNLAVMAPNGGMPVAPEALEALGATDVDVADGHLYKHRLLDDDTVLAFLGDVVPIQPLGMAVSAGDFVLFAGILGVVVALVLPARRRR